MILIVLLFTGCLAYSQSMDPQYIHEGIGFAARGEFERAKVEFERALHADSLDYYAEIYLKIAEDALEQKINREAAIHIFQAMTYDELTHFEERIAELDKAAELAPDYPKIYVIRGLAFSSNDLFDDAISDFDRAVELNSNEVYAYYGRGFVYYLTDRLTNAVIDLKKALELRPAFPQARLILGIVYDFAGRYDAAIMEFDKILELHGSYPDLYYHRGNVYFNMGDTVSAISDYSKAIEQNPEDADALINRGTLYGDQGFYDKAISDLDRAINLDSTNVLAYFNKASVLEKAGDKDAAAETYEYVIRHASPHNSREVSVARQRLSELKYPGYVRMFYLLAYGGWGRPTGEISKIWNEMFLSIPATEIYRNSLQLGFVGGMRRKNFFAEASLEGGFLSLTDKGKEMIKTELNDDRKVEFEFFSLELTIGKYFPVTSRFLPYISVAGGIVIQTLRFEGEEAVEENAGLGIAFKAGVDYYPGKTRRYFLRPGIRYQVDVTEVGVPRVFTFYLGIGLSF